MGRSGHLNIDFTSDDVTELLTLAQEPVLTELLALITRTKAQARQQWLDGPDPHQVAATYAEFRDLAAQVITDEGADPSNAEQLRPPAHDTPS